MARAEGNELRIDHDSDALAIMEGVNQLLKPHGLEFKEDGEEHDGYCIYALEKTILHPHHHSRAENQ